MGTEGAVSGAENFVLQEASLTTPAPIRLPLSSPLPCS